MDRRRMSEIDRPTFHAIRSGGASELRLFAALLLSSHRQDHQHDIGTYEVLYGPGVI